MMKKSCQTQLKLTIQPLHVSVNSVFKESMKSHSSRWFATEVKEALEQGLEIANVLPY